jgi:hypothetical protein
MSYTGDWALYHVAIPAECYKYMRSKDKKAHLFVVPVTVNGTELDKDVWIPKSQCKEWRQQDKKIHFDCPYKILIENGLDFYIDTTGEPSLFEEPEDDVEARLAAESEKLAENFHLKSPVSGSIREVLRGLKK